MNLKTRLRVFSGVLVIILAGAFFCPAPLCGQAPEPKTFGTAEGDDTAGFGRDPGAGDRDPGDGGVHSTPCPERQVGTQFPDRDDPEAASRGQRAHRPETHGSGGYTRRAADPRNAPGRRATVERDRGADSRLAQGAHRTGRCTQGGTGPALRDERYLDQDA